MSLKDILKIDKLKVTYLVVVFFSLYFVLNLFLGNSFNLKIINDNQIINYLLIFLFVLGSFFFAALSYYFLSFHKLSLFRTFIFQFGSNLLNKILPSGIGALGMNYLYLKKNKSSITEAVATLFINNSLGALQAILIFILILTFGANRYLSFSKLDYKYLLIFIGILLICYFVYLINAKLRKIVNKFLSELLNTLKLFTKRKKEISLALITQVLISLFNSLALYFSLKCFGVNLGYLNIFIVYIIGVFFGTFIPLPGGLGGVELGLSAMLIIFGVHSNISISAVLLFRLFNYWIPLVIGIPILFYIKKFKLI